MHYWKDESGWHSETIDDMIFPTFGRVFTPAITVDHRAILPSPNVVWEYYDPLQDVSKIYYWAPTLSSPEVVATGALAHSVQHPTIAIDGSPKPHVLWQDNFFGEIRHSYREGVGNWHAPFVVASGGSHPCADESQGMIHAVWEQGSPSDIAFGRFTGTIWETCPISNTDNPSQFPVLEDSNVVWSEPTQIPGDYEVFYSKWDGGLGAEFTCGTPPENLSGTPTPSMYPQGCFHFIVNPWGTPRCHRFYVTWTEDLLSHQRLLFTDHVPAE